MRQILLGTIIGFVLSAGTVSANSSPSLDAVFHPVDRDSLEKIAQAFESAQETIDIAIYNLDVKDKSPIMQVLKSESLQKRILSKDLKIRLIFEGYAGSEKAAEVMTILESLGIDCRELASGKKVHHKFAVIDTETDSPTVISGSANWSFTSFDGYDEAIIFAEGYKRLAQGFAWEFTQLWNASNEFGTDFDLNVADAMSIEDPTLWGEQSLSEHGITAYFNTFNFEIKGKRITKKKDRLFEGYYLTRKIVEALNGTKSGDKVKIATTRIKLRPIYDAIVNAAKRGVKFDIITGMDQYQYESTRAKAKLDKECDNSERAWDQDCSSSVNFTTHLDKSEFEGKENINLRVKYYNLQKDSFLTKQMHAKYFVINDDIVFSGSLNWSYSGEYSHIENIVVADGEQHPEFVKEFLENFDMVFGRNRDKYTAYVSKLENALESGIKLESCAFEPMALGLAEVDHLLGAASRVNKKIKEAEGTSSKVKLLDACK